MSSINNKSKSLSKSYFDFLIIFLLLNFLLHPKIWILTFNKFSILSNSSNDELMIYFQNPYYIHL